VIVWKTWSSTKKVIEATFPFGALAAAERVTGVFTTTVALLAGAVIETVGGIPTMIPPPVPPEVTFTVTAADVDVKPSESVAIAVSKLGSASPVEGSTF
jgi:hypothetical protein